MLDTKGKKLQPMDNLIEHLIKLVCYISFPLILLFLLTIAISLIMTGGLNTNVNNANSFINVLLIFSLPMIVSLAIISLVIKIAVEKNSLEQLGVATPKKKNVIMCIVMSLTSIALAVILSNAKGLNVSAWTVLIHFFFVAVAEEIILRSVILDELQYITTNKLLLCMINGAIFAFIYHSSEDFASNLLVRVPLGVVLCVIRIKCDSVYPAIAFHWLYNMFVSTI